MNKKYYYSSDYFTLFNGNCVDILKDISDIDMIFADPPYFLSNGGRTINSGKIVSVNKGEWDRIPNDINIDDFNYQWLEASRKSLKKNGTIWISGTVHNIYSIVKILEELNFKIINSIIWQKTNPPPNFSCRCFTHSAEIIIWARKEKKSAHYYNYELMKALNGGTQMKDIWSLPSIAPWEKTYGKHPTQKPLSVLSRVILSSTKKKELVVDPFTGSSTTGIAANLFCRDFIGIDTNKNYLDLSIKRKQQLDNINPISIIKKINSLNYDILSQFDLVPDPQ